MTDALIRHFLQDSLVLWRVDATIETGEAPVVAVIRASDGTKVRVERFPVRPERVEGRTPGAFRWIVHADRSRPCASIAGVLNALRSALGVERGEPIRVVATP